MSINPSRMRENLSLLKGLNFSEFIATALATRGLGRYAAYELMREIVETVYRDGIEFGALLKKHEKVRQYLSEEEIDDLLDPESNLGIMEPQIHAALSEMEDVKKPEGK
jgi:adenylosuccinate lyase